MKLLIEVHMDNAAFEDTREINRILEQAALRVHRAMEDPRAMNWEEMEVGEHCESNLLDTNGNTVGSVRLVKD